MDNDEKELRLPNTKEVEKVGNSLLARAEALRITDNNSYTEGADLLLVIKTNQKRIEPIMEEPVAIQRSALERVRAWRDKYLQPVEAARQIVARKIGEWDTKIRDKRRKEAEEAEAEARKEAQRIRDEQIKKAQKLGDRDTVDNLKAAPIVPIVPAPRTPEPPKIEGVSTTYVYDFEIVAPEKLGPEFMIPDEKAIRKIVNSLGKKAQNVLGPGVRVFEKPKTSGRG